MNPTFVCFSVWYFHFPGMQLSYSCKRNIHSIYILLHCLCGISISVFWSHVKYTGYHLFVLQFVSNGFGTGRTKYVYASCVCSLWYCKQYQWLLTQGS